MNRIGCVYRATSHAFGEVFAQPPMHEDHPSLHGEPGYPSWTILSEEVKDRGVIVVWKSAVVIGLADSNQERQPVETPSGEAN